MTKDEPFAGEKDRYGFVALGPPDNQITENLRIFFEQGLKFRVKLFESAEKIDEYINRESYGRITSEGRDQICMGVILEKGMNNQYIYSLHYNVSGDQAFHDIERIHSNPIKQTRKYVREDTELYNQMLRSGLFYLTNLIDNMILAQSKGNLSARINARITQMPMEPYKASNIYDVNNDGVLLVYAIEFPILVVYLRFIYSVLKERELGIAQNLRSVGLGYTSYYLNWIIPYFLKSVVYATTFSSFLCFSLLPNINFWIIWLVFFLSSMVFFSIAVVIIGFVDRANIGLICGMVIYTLSFASEITIFLFQELKYDQLKWFSVSPILSLTKMGRVMVILQGYYINYDFSHFSKEVNDYKFSLYFWVSITQSVVLTCLGIYIDMVYPKALGISRHPLFCFEKRKKKVSKRVVTLIGGSFTAEIEERERRL